MHGVRAAMRAGEIHRCGAGVDVRLILLAGEAVQREGDAAVVDVGDGIYAFAVEPLARDVQPDIGLVLMVGLQDLHIEARGGAKILHGLAGGGDAVRPADVAIGSRHVGQYADPDGGLRLGAGAAGEGGGCGGAQQQAACEI